MPASNPSDAWDLLEHSGPPSPRSTFDLPSAPSTPPACDQIHEDTSFANLVAALQGTEEGKAVAVQWLFRHAYYHSNRAAIRECGALDALRLVVESVDEAYATRLCALACVGELLEDEDDDNENLHEACGERVRDPTPADYARVFDAMDLSTTSSANDRVVALESLFCLASLRPHAPELG